MSVEISSQLNLGTDVGESQAWVLNELGPVLAKAGYSATNTASESVSFTRKYLPGWAFVVGLLTFPIGLLLFVLVRSTDTLVVALLPPNSEGYVLATATGKGPKKVRELFVKLNREGIAMHPTTAPPPPVQRATSPTEVQN